MLSFFSSHWNWDSPTPSPPGECAPPPLVRGGGANSLAGDGLGGSQFQRGNIRCGTLGIYATHILHFPHMNVSFVICQSLRAKTLYMPQATCVHVAWRTTRRLLAAPPRTEPFQSPPVGRPSTTQRPDGKPVRRQQSPDRQ